MMTIIEALNFSEKRLSSINYHLEMTNKLPCRSFYEKQQEMLILAVSALKKQIPLRPIEEPKVWPDGQEYTVMLCPKCKESVSAFSERYCSSCGQKLNWSEKK
jgi:hypothetical protein